MKKDHLLPACLVGGLILLLTALLALALLLLCGGVCWLTQQDQRVPTAARPAPTRAVAVPTEQPPPERPRTPTLAPGITRTPPTPPPAIIDPQALRESLWGQGSLRWTVTVTNTAQGRVSYVEATRVSEPDSYAIRVFEQGALLAHVVHIGAREWLGLGTEPTWLPLSTAAGSTAELARSARDLALTSLAVVLPRQEARLVRSGVIVGGVSCAEYTWSDGPDTGRVFVAADSGWPVQASVGPVTVQVSHVNDPANVIQSPLTEFPDRLHIDEARMALNGLTSFQWTATIHWVPGPGAQSDPGFFWTFRGVCVQTAPAWRADLWMNEAATGAPDLRFMQVGARKWTALGAADQPWLVALPSMEKQFREPQPFYTWRQMQHVSLGSLVARNAQTLDGRPCHEYRFTARFQNDQGQWLSQEVRLYATADAGLPLAVETTARSEATGDVITLTWTLSHVDDPANQVSPPAS